ncbi:hypothetical protein VTO73DRAFT_11508 [Trametes versicolor]
MLTNAPGLTDLTPISCSGDLLANIAPEALLQLRTLSVQVDQASDMAPEDWYPSADTLRVLSALPVLERLVVELGADRYDVEFVGFRSLTALTIIDCGAGDATWFLEKCPSPRLHTLTIDFTNLYVNLLRWEDLHPLCSVIAQSAPELHDLNVSFRYFDERPERSPDILLTATHPLFALRHLTHLSLCFDYGEIVLSDAALESFARAWPALVDLSICFRVLRHSDPNAPPAYPAAVTLRSFRAFAIHCPNLQSLHIPHLYITVEDYTDDTDWVRSGCPQDHQLLKLAVCRAIVSDVRWCAGALSRIFPHLDVDGSRSLFLGSHDGQNFDAGQDRVFSVIWLSLLDVFNESRTPPPKPDGEEPSTFDGSQSERLGN